jgi:ComF family protein
MKYKLKTILLKLIALFYPVTCVLCGDDLNSSCNTAICNKCKVSLPLIKGLVCQKCGMPLYDGGEFCRECRKHSKEYNFDKMRSVYLYKDSARRLILKFKYSGRSFLAQDLGLAMNETLRQYDFYNDSDFVIPIPLNILRKIKRGYNQAELLAEEISLKTNIPLLKNVLFRRRITKPQFKLSKIERSKNIKDSFFVKNNTIIKNKTILLIDDIATTSITVSSCSSALKTAGVKKVYVLTLARD